MKEESVNKFEVGENLKMIQKVFRKEGNSEMEVGMERINVQFVGMKPKSETICLVKIIDRGKGWNEETKSYTGVKKNNSWCRGQRMDFGKVIECNIKNLN